MKRLKKINAILQLLTDNKGKAFTATSLINRLNHEWLPENVEFILRDLVDEIKIKRTEKDDTLYYSI